MAATIFVPKTINDVIVILGVLATMSYFFFTFGGGNPVLKRTAQVGRWVMMSAFGASFGNYIVVASNTGFTARHFKGQGIQVVCVTHQNGFHEPGMDEMGPATRSELKQAGMEVLTTTHLQKQGGLYAGGIISDCECSLRAPKWRWRSPSWRLMQV